VGESFLVTIEVVTKMQLKSLTHMFCILMSSYKVCKEGAFLKKIQIKNHLSFGMNSNKLNPQGET
jgi:hypothetical protein